MRAARRSSPETHALYISRAWLPEKAPGQVSGTGGRSPGSLVYSVNRHTGSAQAADDTQTAVMHDVRVELQHDGRCIGVERVVKADHGKRR